MELSRPSVSPTEWSSIWDRLRDENECYNPKILTQYTPNSKEVYGEVNPRFVDELIREAAVGDNDVFYDLGSGVGNVVLQVAAQTGCNAVGIEIREELHTIALSLRTHTMQLVGSDRTWCFDRTVFIHGDVSDASLEFGEASVLFVNNFCFPPGLEQAVLHKFQRMLKDGTRVISTKSFGPRFRPLSFRCKDDPCHMFKYPWRTRCSASDAVSWTDKPVEYFIYTVDKTSPRPAIVHRVQHNAEEVARDTLMNIFGSQHSEDVLMDILRKNRNNVNKSIECLLLSSGSNTNATKNPSIARPSRVQFNAKAKMKGRPRQSENGHCGENADHEYSSGDQSKKKGHPIVPLGSLLGELFPHVDRELIAHASQGAEYEDLNSAIDWILCETSTSEETIKNANRRKNNEKKKKEGMEGKRERKKPKSPGKVQPTMMDGEDKQLQKEQATTHERWEAMEQLALLFPGTAPSALLKLLLETGNDLNKAAEKLLLQSQQKEARQQRATKRGMDVTDNGGGQVQRHKAQDHLGQLKQSPKRLRTNVVSNAQQEDPLSKAAQPPPKEHKKAHKRGRMPRTSTAQTNTREGLANQLHNMFPGTTRDFICGALSAAEGDMEKAVDRIIISLQQKASREERFQIRKRKAPLEAEQGNKLEQNNTDSMTDLKTTETKPRRRKRKKRLSRTAQEEQSI